MNADAIQPRKITRYLPDLIFSAAFILLEFTRHWLLALATILLLILSESRRRPETKDRLLFGAFVLGLALVITGIIIVLSRVLYW